MFEIKTWVDKTGKQWAMFTGKFDAKDAIENIKKYIHKRADK